MREIPKKNYIILTLICVFTILLAIYISSWYLMANDINNESIFVEQSLELKLDEIDNYLLENPNCIIYISEDNENVKLENQIYDYMLDKTNLNNFVHINSKDYSAEELEKALKEVSKIKIDNSYPNVYITKDSRIVSALVEKDEEITITKFKKYVEEEIIND